MAAKRPPLRILCLHGFLQSGDLLRQRTGALRKALKSLAQFEFVTAPLTVTYESLLEDDLVASNAVQVDPDARESMHTWWRLNADRTVYSDFEGSLRHLEHVFKTEGPFDGVLGFSQGAAVVGILCALRDRPGYEWLAFRFAIMISGFKALDAAFQHHYDAPLAVPSLHLFGEGDIRVVPARSVALSQCFVDPVVVRHSGGHFIPCDGTTKPAYIDFLKAFGGV